MAWAVSALIQQDLTGLKLAGKERMETKMETTTVGYNIETTIRIHL